MRIQQSVRRSPKIPDSTRAPEKGLLFSRVPNLQWLGIFLWHYGRKGRKDFA